MVLTIEQGQDFVSEFMLAVGELLGELPDDFPALYEAIDADALAALFGPTQPPNSQFEGTLSFRIGDHMVHLETLSGVEGQATEDKVLITITNY